MIIAMTIRKCHVSCCLAAGISQLSCCLAAGITALLVGCTAGDDEHLAPPPQENNAIVLGVKEVASPVTRAGQHTGSMDFAQLRTTGFGVYGYKGAYSSLSSLPTLFADDATNTLVTFDPDGTTTPPTTLLDIPGSWTYPGTLKEWENVGSTTEKQKYTFFAYAPYMDSDGTAPGITTVKQDVTAGDPTIGYTVATSPAQSVDLLWGVRTDTKEKAGLPWIDIQRGQTASAVLFTFYHALCALGYHAQVIVDQDNRLTDLEDKSSLSTIGQPNGCKVTLKSITFEPDNKRSKEGLFYSSGVLNLNNTTAHQPLWSTKSGSIASLVIDDGMTDGHGTIDATLLDPKTTDFGDSNPNNFDVMTDESYDTEVPGIVESANTQTIIAKDGSGNEQFYMLIPYEAKDYKLTIEYYITYKTASSYHREAHIGTATLPDLELEAGVKYYINLVFGLTTFKVSVTAQDWEETTTPVTIATETGTSASHSLAPRWNRY